MEKFWGFVKPHLIKRDGYWEAFKRNGGGFVEIKSAQFPCPKMAMLDLRVKASAMNIVLWDDVFWMDSAPL